MVSVADALAREVGAEAVNDYTMVDRYEVIDISDPGSADMLSCETGDWVGYEDYKFLVDRLDAILDVCRRADTPGDMPTKPLATEWLTHGILLGQKNLADTLIQIAEAPRCGSTGLHKWEGGPNATYTCVWCGEFDDGKLVATP